MSNQVCAAVRIKKWIQLSKLLQFHVNWILWKSSESKAWKPQSSSLIQSRWKEMIHVWKMRRFACREKSTQCLTTSSEKSRNRNLFLYISNTSAAWLCVILPQSWSLFIIVHDSHVCQTYLQLLFKRCFSRNVKDQKMKVFCVVSYNKLNLMCESWGDECFYRCWSDERQVLLMDPFICPQSFSSCIQTTTVFIIISF